MKLTPDQRRDRLQEMMDKNPDYLRMKAFYAPAKAWFDRFTAFLPKRLRSRLHEYPGMFYLMHQRTIDTICREMKFLDED